MISRLLGLTSRSFWKEFRHSNRGVRRPKPNLNVSLFEDGFALNLFGIYIPLLFLDRLRYHPHELMEQWGVYYFSASIVLCWGRHTKYIHMPWQLEQYSREVQRADGSWVPFVGSWEEGPLRVVNNKGATFGGKEPDGRHEMEFSYRYTLRSGEVHERTAKVHIERSEYRWRWFKQRIPWPRKRCQYIDVQFSAEVGERTGSWKGGCIGCAYDMLPGETALDTLRRMERERKFT